MSQIRLPEGFVEELKTRVRPSDVIGRKVKLARRGKEWVGLSPFTNEKTPSFYVNDAKRMFKCFSSGIGGDVIKFLQETERLSFMEAVERLADEAGMVLPTASPEEQAAYDRRARLKAACGAANAFFQARLRDGVGAKARTYLQDKRGLGPDAWTRHGVGYAPDDWRTLFDHLAGQGFTTDEIMGAGLAKTSEKAKEPYDLFRDRIMFPIFWRGDVIAFGGRALSPDAHAKYMNSPDTDLFHKSRVLYNYDRAKASLGYGERGGLIVCEGYMDVIALHEAGFENAVAPLGTALTEDQLALVWKAGPDPVLCFDGDRAGLGAAYKALNLALPHALPDKSAYFALLPDKMDPDDLIKAKGRPGMAAELDRALSLFDMLWRREVEAEPLDTPERKAGLEARLKDAVATIKHDAVRNAYDRDVRQRLRDFFWAARKTTGASGARKSARGWRLKTTPGLGLLARAASSPALIERAGEELAAASFSDPDVAAIRDALMDLVHADGKVDRSALNDHLNRSGRTRAAHLLGDYPETPPIDPDGEEGREWLIGLEQFSALTTSSGAGATPADDATVSAAAWRRAHQEVAGRQALKARARDLDNT
ncbi:MAG: DNA primase [Pseudomonadota bacterium]